MSSSYTKDLTTEIAYKLPMGSIYSISTVSNEWSRLLDNDFWLTKFIRSFGSTLPTGTDYERECVTIENMLLENLYRYVVIKNYIKLLAYMLSKWNIPKSLIYIAAKIGNLEIVKILLANGADIHAENDWALRSAAANGHLEIITFLLANGADIHVHDDLALMWAAENGHIAVTKLLLANGADIHAQNDQALIWAAYINNLELVKLLLANGADIHARRNKALRWAEYNGNLKLIKLLLDNGAT